MIDQRQAPCAALTIPRQATIEGSLDYPGPLVIEGTLLGEVRGTSLVVAKCAVVIGTIKADVVTIMGEVSGDVFANQLTLKAACSVTGDIFHKQLALEEGCRFEGKSRRYAKPLMLLT